MKIRKIKISQKERILRSVICVKGIKKSDCSDVIEKLCLVPYVFVSALKDCKNFKINICKDNITNIYKELKSITPRGWDKKYSWDDVNGCFASCDHTDNFNVSIALTKDERGYLIDVNKTGSHCVVLHEMGHAVDHLYRISNSKKFKNVRRKDFDRLTPYLKQEGEAGLLETFAEVFARFYGDCDYLKEELPNLYNYFLMLTVDINPDQQLHHC